MGEENQQALDILEKINPKGNQFSNVNDIQNYTPQNLTPQQTQAFNAQYAPDVNAGQNDYYPDINHHIAVGNYGGSEIGNTTLFAPGGGLVPLGLMDARDAAVHHAAAKKAKDIEDFNKQFESPTTKHVAVQKNLTDQYYKGLQDWQQNALKKAGGNQGLANQMLKNDPKFNEWNKGMQDTAKFHDAIVEHSAQLHADEKDPNFVMSPELKQQQAKLMSGIAYQGDPFSEKGKKIGKEFIASQALYDLDKSVNVAIDKAIPDIQQLDPTFQTRGKNETATYLEKEYFTPEAKKDIAHNIFMEKYQGTGVTEDQVLKNVEAKLGEKIRRKTDTYDKWFKPDTAGHAEDYSNARPVSETSFNVGSKTGGAKGITEIYSDKSFKTTAGDEQKKISVPLSQNTIDTQGKKLNLKAGNVEGNVSQVFQGYYNQVQKRFLSPDEVKDLKAGKVNVSHDIIVKPAVMFNIAKEHGDKGEKNSLILDVNEIKGKFPKKGKEKKSFDDVITDLEQSAETENANRKGTGWPTSTKKETVKAEDLRKKYNY